MVILSEIRNIYICIRRYLVMKIQKQKYVYMMIIIFLLNILIFRMIQYNSHYVHYNATRETDNVRSSDWKLQKTLNVDLHPYNVYVGDANNDGFNDIITADFWSDREVSILLWNNTIKDWNPLIQRNVGPHPLYAVIADANNDGYNDIIGTNLNNDEVAILLWNNTIQDWDPKITRVVGDECVCVCVGDVNEDGYNDIVTTNVDDDDISILTWNDTLNNWDARIDVLVGNAPQFLSINDANNDAQNEIIVANYDSSVSILNWNNISKTWDTEETISVGNTPQSVICDDVNNDGYNDITVAFGNINQVSILLWNEVAGNWNPEIMRDVGIRAGSVHVGDADNDGYNDIATSSNADDKVSVLCWNETSRNWDPEITRDVGDQPSSVFIDDADNDGKNDIVTSNQADNTVSILSWTLDKPHLELITPNPDNDGSITLNWEHINSASIYYIYRARNNFSSLENTTLLTTTSLNSYNDRNLGNGEYFYAVIAGDMVRNSTISNIASVTISLRKENFIPGYDIITMFGIICLVTFFILKRRYK
jgi:hypothetical protein